jgi:hypothetical protein
LVLPLRRGGQLVLRMLADVRRKTIRPIIEAAVAKGFGAQIG